MWRGGWRKQLRRVHKTAMSIFNWQYGNIAFLKIVGGLLYRYPNSYLKPWDPLCFGFQSFRDFIKIIWYMFYIIQSEGTRIASHNHITISIAKYKNLH